MPAAIAAAPRASARSRVVDAACALLHRTGLLWLGVRLRRLLGGGRARVLCYHRVARDGRPGTLSTERFEAHLRHLRANYRIVPPSEIADAVRTGAAPPRDAVAVTFDDGYRDLVAEALPLLGRHGVRAGFFVLTGHLPGTGTLFLDRIRGTPLEAVRRDLASMPAADRERRLAAAPAGGSPALMDAGDLRALAAAGHEVGSHGRAHGLLTALPEDEVRREIADSRGDLRVHAGIEARLFAWPWGDSDPAARAVAREGGYDAAFSTAGGGVGAGVDPFAIPRIHVPGDASTSRLACEAAGLLGALRGVLP